MLDHFGMDVGDYEAAKQFFSAALAPLGYIVMMEGYGWCGMGADGKPDLWFRGAKNGATHPYHLAFRAADREQVRAFHRAAIAAGAKDNGEPGVRPQYHPTYYGAFVIDLDGNNIEAVCHGPE